MVYVWLDAPNVHSTASKIAAALLRLPPPFNTVSCRNIQKKLQLNYKTKARISDTTRLHTFYWNRPKLKINHLCTSLLQDGVAMSLDCALITRTRTRTRNSNRERDRDRNFPKLF